MVKVHGIAYIIVGLAVAIFSKFIDSKTGENSLMLFFYAGIGFILVGIIKLLILRKPKEKIHHTALQYKKCRYCGTHLYPNAKFCHVCRSRI